MENKNLGNILYKNPDTENDGEEDKKGGGSDTEDT